MSIATQILNQRRKKKLSQSALAAAIGVDRLTVNRWENDHATPRSGLLASIATALDMSLEDLLGQGQ